MRTYATLSWFFPILTVLAPGCMSITDPPSPRKFESGGPSAAPPSNCNDAEEDDACTRCQRQSCCWEIGRCNESSGDCRTWYANYHACVYPDGTWSGFSSLECQKITGVAGNPAASALIACFNTQCADDSACGVEPRAGFAFPPPSPTRDFSAALFLENYCNGCHAPGKLGPTGELSVFTSNPKWIAPCSDPDWFTSMDFTVVTSKADIVACGVRADILPAECLTLNSVRAGFFTKPAKFPPSGIGGYASCPYTLPNGGCPQPTLFERARLLSWISGGARW